MKIDGTEATFDVSVIGERTNDTYMGRFKVKCLLSPIEEIDADRRFREMLGVDYHRAQKRVQELAFALSQLEYRVIEAPPFWNGPNIVPGSHVVDDNVIQEVLELAIDAQDQYLKGKKAELKERQERLQQAIKNKDIEKEPEVDSIDAPDEEELLDEEDGTELE